MKPISKRALGLISALSQAGGVGGLGMRRPSTGMSLAEGVVAEVSDDVVPSRR